MPVKIGAKTYTEGLTHPATFHADDVFATALLQIVDPDFPVRRGTPDQAGPTTLVFDQGNTEFDHHGTNTPRRKNGVPYSSFGLLWSKLGSKLVHPHDANLIDEQLVQPIDTVDDEGGFNMVSTMIVDIQAAYDTPDEAFPHAVEFAKGILQRRINNLNKTREGAKLVTKEIKRQNKPSVLVLDKWIPGWWRATSRSSVAYCVFPSERGGWAAQAVSDNNGRTICPFPAEWRGKFDEDLQKVSEVTDSTFCHKSGFIAVAKSKEGATELAEKSYRIWRERLREGRAW